MFLRKKNTVVFFMCGIPSAASCTPKMQKKKFDKKRPKKSLKSYKEKSSQTTYVTILSSQPSFIQSQNFSQATKRSEIHALFAPQRFYQTTRERFGLCQKALNPGIQKTYKQHKRQIKLNENHQKTTYLKTVPTENKSNISNDPIIHKPSPFRSKITSLYDLKKSTVSIQINNPPTIQQSQVLMDYFNPLPLQEQQINFYLQSRNNSLSILPKE